MFFSFVCNKITKINELVLQSPNSKIEVFRFHSIKKKTKIQHLLHGHTIQCETSPLMNTSEILH